MQRIAIQNTLRAARRQALNPHVVRAASKRFNSSQAALSGASKSSSSSVNGAKLLFPLSIVAGLAFVFQDMIDVKIVSPPKKEDKKEQPATEEQPSEVFEQEPAINEESTEESGSDDAESNASPRSDAPSEKKPSEEKHDLSDEKPVESEKKEGETKEEKEQEAKEESNEESQEGEQAGGQAAAFNPETGEINWDCPCLGGMASGPCGEEFKAAFSCFVYSEADPKGIDCIEKFKGMQDCFRQHPDVYAEELREDEVPVGQSEEAGATEQEPKAEDKKPEEEKSEENNE